MRILYVAAYAPLAFCFGCRPTPPDLSECTRLEIQSPGGAIYYFFTGEEGIFNAEEEQYIRSFDAWTVADRDVIKTFAEDVRQGVYRGRKQGETSPGLTVTCYRDSIRVAVLDATYGAITTEDGEIFAYPQKLRDLTVLTPPGIQRFQPRYGCAFRIRQLCTLTPFSGRRATPYPDPARWCDAVVDALRQLHMSRGGRPMVRTYDDAEIARMFRCPAAHDHASAHADTTQAGTKTVRTWVSDYAMNPHCDPNSPPDTVRLFETRPGWNQRGGPELFTMDNHDPKGGCVLLNDGTAKFIRTKEELEQLRWKP